MSHTIGKIAGFIAGLFVGHACAHRITTTVVSRNAASRRLNDLVTWYS